jgi:hypothetical protein
MLSLLLHLDAEGIVRIVSCIMLNQLRYRLNASVILGLKIDVGSGE